MDTPAQLHWTASRATGLERLADFAPRMGHAYAAGRNYDLGPGKHGRVSGLSPYVRRRLVTERELVAAALAHHGPAAAEKFVQEVFWRSYFRGWLEARPAVWDAYRQGLARDLDMLAEAPGLAKHVAAAETGRTGLACFDAWMHELIDTGYLHNHARMWAASIWIFTLRLPWRIGADLFLRHLIDGCPASNTLGWRWVAGLHTRGKSYQAQAWNIAKFTQGRFTPGDAELADVALPLEEPDPPRPAPLRPVVAPDRALPTALLVTEEDLTPEQADLAGRDLVAVATLRASALRSPREVSPVVADFDRAALADAAERLQAAGAPAAEALTAGPPGSLTAWAQDRGVRQIATVFVPVGPVRDWLDREAEPLAQAGIRLAEFCRDWDRRIWPHATAGFFKVKKQIPRLLREFELID